ncbi:MarR family winged helix-turn-helix transcriptional regulator [Novispirillum sp. DQ9]|uniref:MarR family winged helix-turn-helix transcriptional regulator n=1 Tax=Novispirillum sp. DQ9 TaxID=3398612 RepID=UPI003C798AB8
MQKSNEIKGEDGGRDPAPLHLDLFIPYRLSVLSNIVSRSVARIYAEKFDLSIPEWRVMAVMGLEEERGTSMCANSVVTRTEMDKVQVSRALSRMLQAGLINRSTDPGDRRRAVLRLTDKGREVYRQIVPAALRYEEDLLENLSLDEQITLERLITKLTKAARAHDVGHEA